MASRSSRRPKRHGDPILRDDSLAAGVSLRDSIVREAEAWIGTPFVHGARVQGAGVDCVQLLIAVYEAVGLVRGVEIGHYPPDWMLHRNDARYLEGISRVAVEVPAPERGDVVLFRVGRAVAHAGIVIEWPVIIHAQTDMKVQRMNVLEHPRWQSAFAGWWSIVTAARQRAAGVI